MAEEAKVVEVKEVKAKKKGHNYKIRYGFSPEIGEFTEEQVKQAKAGGTDALILFNLLFPGGGQYLCDYVSIDGRTSKPVADEELFRVWVFLANKLAQSEGLDDGKKAFAGEVFKTFVNAVQKAEKQLKQTANEEKEGKEVADQG